MNSICVIDGQHRIFAHYEGVEADKSEAKVAQLRKKLHLLVTGLIFPDEMSMEERIQFESEIFLDINSHAKPIPPNVLLQIEMLNNPLSAHGIARRVIETLNKGNGCFQNMFAISSLDKSKIKIASIVKFALRYLVALEPSEGRKNLYEYWDGDKQKLGERNEAEIKSYVKFCAKTVSLFFGVVKEQFLNYWNDQDSRLLSVTSINGFIIALTFLINQYGVQNRDFYKTKLQKLVIDFSEDGFLYKSSQYHKFAEEILRQIEN